MKFVQIVEMPTSRFDEIRKVGDEWEAAIGDDRKAGQRVTCQDRDQPGRYLEIAFFDSYEEAMENSNHPVTQAFAGKLADLLDGPVVFHNLDVLDERS
jgi:hypothetical protein